MIFPDFGIVFCRDIQQTRLIRGFALRGFAYSRKNYGGSIFRIAA
jgi:hypothetical protein